MCLSRAHCVERKKGCVFTSEAPARDPKRRASSLMRSLRMMDLQRLGLFSKRPCYVECLPYVEVCGAPLSSGNGTSSRRMFAKVAFRFFPLKGVVPNNIS